MSLSIDRRAVLRVLLVLLLALAILGHAVVLLLGALDALVTALLGVPRLAYGSRRFVELVWRTWEEQR